MLKRIGFVAVFVAIITAPIFSADNKVDGLTLKIEQLSDSPYPFQAFQLRLSLHNAGQKRAGRLDFFQANTLAFIKGPQDAGYRDLLEFLPSVPGGVRGPSKLDLMTGKVPIYLETGERLSISFPVAAEWEWKKHLEGEKLRFVNHGKSIFPEPGQYSLKVAYRFEALHFEQTIEIDVRTPENEDNQVFQILKKDPPLASALMCPIDPPQEALIPKLKDIIERFPKSSYTDYARFALARGYWRGNGVRPYSRRVASALAADRLEMVVQKRWDPKLKKVVPNRFAYLPDALLLFKWTEPAAKMDVIRHLDRRFPDARVWLEEVASSFGFGDPDKRELVEFLLNRKIPDGPNQLQPFIIECWRSYRKRVPSEDEEKRPLP